MIRITPEEARLYLLSYQKLYPPRSLKTETDLLEFIRKIGCIQYDPLNITGRNADLVVQSRYGDGTLDTLYGLLYEKRELYDGWDKNMSVIPVTHWPLFEPKRRFNNDKYREHLERYRHIRGKILEMLNEKDSLCSRDVITGEKIRWPWGQADTGRTVLESMFNTGELAVHHKEGVIKFYGLTKHIFPELLTDSGTCLPDRDFRDWYVKRRIGSVGLLWNRSGEAWLGTGIKTGKRKESLVRLLKSDVLRELKIDGFNEDFYIPAEAEKLLNQVRTGIPEKQEAALIAPLDNLLWDRRMVQMLFGFEYRWEVYTPKNKRKYGYYVLPLLSGDRFVGRIEPVMNWKTGCLTIRNWWDEEDVQIEKLNAPGIIKCLNHFKTFLGAGKIVSGDGLEKSRRMLIEKADL
jgi:hypothetical protein